MTVAELETPLDRDWIWRGKDYPKGTTTIPADFAEALQLKQGVSLKQAPPPAASAKIAKKPPAIAEPLGINPPSETAPNLTPDDTPTVADLAVGTGDAALELINSAKDADAIATLPGIGKGAAERILLHRPKKGYPSFDAVIESNEELPKHPYRVSWDKVQAWEG